jgi:hypothetical protein
VDEARAVASLLKPVARESATTSRRSKPVAGELRSIASRLQSIAGESATTSSGLKVLAGGLKAATDRFRRAGTMASLLNEEKKEAGGYFYVARPPSFAPWHECLGYRGSAGQAGFKKELLKLA